MLRTRVLVVLGLLPFGLLLIAWGGWVFAGAVALILAWAGVEYARLFRAAGVHASPLLVGVGAALLTLARQLDGFASAPLVLTALTLVTMAYHLTAYERGRDPAAGDFAATLGGMLYIGWLGAYWVSLRNLPHGVWWFLLVLPAIWIADAAAYLVGVRFGRHRLTRRVSPNKTWEGYLGGILVTPPLSALLAALWGQLGGGASLTPLAGAWLGLAMAALSTLGDLGESMIKRQAGVKDSGNLLPGHGGVFDRIDSWLWGVPIGYYLILWFFQPIAP